MTKVKSLAGLYRFQKQINNLQKLDVVKELLDELAEIAQNTIQSEHNKIQMKYANNFMGKNDSKTTVKISGKGNTRTITASGKSVLFVEYGTGVHFNTPQSKRPTDIANIGEYGKGKGSNDYWFYSQYGRGKVYTQGNPAALGVEKAMQAMKQHLREKGL